MLMFWVDEHMNRQCLTALQQDPCIAVLDFGTQGNRPANSASVVQERCPQGSWGQRLSDGQGMLSKKQPKYKKNVQKDNPASKKETIQKQNKQIIT